MDNVEEVIKRAELLTGGTRAERAQARALLEKLLGDDPYAPGARKALKVLERLDGRPSAADLVPGLLEFSRRWDEIHSLTHVGLLKFLRDLKSEPAIAARLLQRVVKDLRTWIAAAVPQINEQTLTDEIDALDRFVSIISDLETYGVELEELKSLRNRLFDVRLGEAKRRIRRALASWSFDDAWKVFKALAKPPAGFEGNVKSLQDEIYSCDRMHCEVDLLVKTAWEAPRNWINAVALAKHTRSLSRCRDDYSLPPKWADLVKGEVARCVKSLGDFLRRRAGEASDLSQVRVFWGKYQGLKLEESYGLGVPKEWVQNALGRLVHETGLEVAAAENLAALVAASEKLLTQRAGLPPSVVEEIELLSGQLDQIAATWKAASAGEEFEMRPAPDVPVPQTFERDLDSSGKRLKQIREAFERLEEDDGTLADEVYLETAALAERILAEMPSHALALGLREEATRRGWQRRIERALAEWQVGELLNLCAQRPEGKYAAYLTENAWVLRTLGELAHAEKFSGWHVAAGWWSLWRATYGYLSPPPALLIEALHREQDRRADEWYVLLSRLLTETLAPEECDQIAASLNIELERLELQAFRKSFLRKARIGYAERLITERDWAGAESRIGEFDEDDREARRMRTRLDLARARVTSIAAVSEVLKDDWSRLVEYLADEAYEILSSALREAWEGGDAETLGQLRMVVSRVTTMREAPPAYHEEFTRWEAWFNVEAAAAGGELGGVKQFVAYLAQQKPSDPDLSRRLAKLIGLWQTRGRVEMLAWGYEAFRRHAPQLFTYNPAEDLRRQTEEVAARTENVIGTNPDLEQSDLEVLRAEVRRHEAAWQRLRDYLNELPEVPERPHTPERFEAARQRLETLYDVSVSVERLQHADLRRPGERKELNAIRRTLNGQLEDVAMQPRLLRQVTRLEPLERLPSLQNRVMEAANDCGDVNKWDEPRLFETLAGRLRDVAAVFDQAEARGGGLWRLISEEYGHSVRAAADSFMPPPAPPHLDELARQFDELAGEERTLNKLWAELWNQKPVLAGPGRFDPEAHRDYLSRLPSRAPRSRRALVNFGKRFASNDNIPTILEQSRRQLPEWICKYLDEGIIFGAPEA
ncbi:MAG: hypothetical protein ACJ74Q_17650 [Pyrinomonadaceae bacterium]